MTWSTSPDVHTFLAAAGDFLSAQPVENTVLLTEAAYLAERTGVATDQLFGWWKPVGGAVAGAFLQAPRHRPILSMMPGAAVKSLANLRPDLPPVGVDGRMVDPVLAAWRDHPGAMLSERSRLTLYRLGHPHLPLPPRGRARTATDADRDLLVAWYRRLMDAYPDDPSDLAYVVDDPLSYGGIVMWEVDGTPTAMAGRSRTVAGMARLGAVYATHDHAHGDAAFAAACATATDVAHDVLAFADTTDITTAATYQRLGFEPVLDRVMLGT